MQLTLSFTRPRTDCADTNALLTALRFGQWLTASQLAVMLAWTDRKVRDVASRTRGAVISYPGSPGYRLFSACSVDEIQHATNALLSQARDMTQRAVDIERMYHTRRAA
jgi:hypothetical protein